MDETSPWIVETSVETFEKDVIERSHDLPVVVDFWATWCGPCQELGPTLEKLAREYDGRFLLVKIDVDKFPEIASGFNVQSIPHVYALRGGQAVNQFLGNLPEDQLRTWIDQLMPSAYDNLIAEAKELAETDPAAAETKYREALELAPDDSTAKIALARLLLSVDQDAASLELIHDLEKRGFLESDAQNIKAELELRAAGGGGIEESRAAVAADPENLALQLQLADALAASRQFEEALQICLDLVQNHKATMGEPAREAMVKMFQVLGPESELTQQFRRKLSIALY